PVANGYECLRGRRVGKRDNLAVVVDEDERFALIISSADVNKVNVGRQHACLESAELIRCLQRWNPQLETQGQLPVRLRSGYGEALVLRRVRHGSQLK